MSLKNNELNLKSSVRKVMSSEHYTIFSALLKQHVFNCLQTV